MAAPWLRPLLVVLFAFAAAAPLAAQNCVINGFNSTRAEAGASFTDGADFSRARANLRDAAYFGSSGVVNRTILIGSGVGAASDSTLAGLDIFITGAATTSSYTSAERAAITTAVNSGVNLIITADDTSHSLSDLFGVTLTNTGAEMSAAAVPDHPIFAGPFGRVTQFRGAGASGSFRAWPAGTLVLATSSAGPTMLLIPRGQLASGSGAVLLLADADILSTAGRDLGNNSSEPSVPVTDALVLNIVNFLCNPSQAAVAPTLVFPQIAHGDGNASSVVLTNASSRTISRVTVSFRDDNGAPLFLSLAGQGSTSGFVMNNLEPNQTVTLNTAGSHTLRSGSVLVTSDPALGGIVLFQVPNAGVTGVASSEAAGGFDLPLVPQPSYTSSSGTDVPSGIAIVNLGGKTTTVRLELWDSLGRRSDGVTFVTLPPYGHTAKFLFELYNLSFAGFSGSLRVVSSTSLIGVTALQLGTQAGQFSALPVKAMFR